MKKLALISLIVFLTTFVYGQEIKISVAPTTNNALYYKFVAGGPGRGFKSGFSASVEYILRNEKRINLGLGLNYQFCRVEFTPNMNTGDFIGQTDIVNLISVSLVSVYDLKKNFYLSVNPLIDFHLNYDAENIIDRQSGVGLSFSFGKYFKLNEEILLNLEPKLWVHNIIPFYGFNLPQRLTVAGLNVGLVFGNKND